jgi:hypothetical protein
MRIHTHVLFAHINLVALRSGVSKRGVMLLARPLGAPRVIESLAAPGANVACWSVHS